MKAVLEFDLPEDNDEFEMATKANQYYLALSDIMEELRKTRKYGDITTEQHKIVEAISTTFHDILMDREISIP